MIIVRKTTWKDKREENRGEDRGTLLAISTIAGSSQAAKTLHHPWFDN
jgi:hypothetical protein